jgi:hypothetical protein
MDYMKDAVRGSKALRGLALVDVLKVYGKILRELSFLYQWLY